MKRTERWMRPDGAVALLEPAGALPVVDLVLRWPVGSLADPPGKAGCMRLVARLLRRGWRGMDEAALEEAIAGLGARLGLGITRESIEIHGTVLAEHAPAFAALLGRMLATPAFRSRDLARSKRELRAELADLRDDDGSLASRHLRDLAFGAHPYGTPAGGTLASLRRVTRADLHEAHERALGTRGMVVGAAGPLDRRDADALFDAFLGGVPRRRVPRVRAPAPRMARGRRVRLVHKADRHQAQLGIATLGTHRADPLRVALLVAETAFGGTFASELTHEIRSVQGWSYSVGSTLRVAERRDLLELWAHPAADVAAACAARELELLERWRAEGPRPADLRRAKTYLVGSRA
ncbi:MAG: pitrilysin family protein, partial [Myxococcota bacterium]